MHEAIRANPMPEKKERKKPAESKKWQQPKLTYEQRKEGLKKKLAALTEADDE